MGKVVIDIGKAIEMRVNGTTLREIGQHFGTSAEAVRQALKRAHKKQREQKKLARLLVAASFDEQGRAKNPADIAKTIDDWTAILDAAKKGIALESEVADLKERIRKVELSIYPTEGNSVETKKT
jgi:orotate phosphoribosyltransferase-like protein